MDATALVLGLWFLSPVPLDTEVTIDQTTWTVVTSIKRPQNEFPVEVRMPYKGRDGSKFLGWVDRTAFAGLDEPELYALTDGMETKLLTRIQVKLR